ncbi:MAG TPA: cellulase family glycosylhydrolase [Mycobacteriales bacterium]|nr:cellulase family glycosylhydrolase [Mycobacteriales bacterium]
MTRRALATLLAALALLPATATATPPRHGPGFLHVGTVAGRAQVLDDAGRTVLLRGVNANGLVDYWRPGLQPPYPVDSRHYTNGRCPASDPVTTAVPLCQRDLAQMRALGFDNLRLPVSWSLLEPAPGRLSSRYLDRIAQVVSWARAQGIWVVIDVHQDAWSKHVVGGTCPPGTTAADGNDGAPAWATRHRTPACAVNGVRELDPAVVEDAQLFWLNAPAADGIGLQDHYAAVVAALARRFAADSTVAGYDLMNEPEPGALPVLAGTAELMPFYAKVVDAVRAAVPRFRQLVLLEPGVERNTTAARSYVLPWSAFSSYRNAVYAPHVYTEVFTAGAVTGLPEVTTFDSDYRAALADAAALGLPLWVGEFGGDPSTDGRVLAQHYAQQDGHLIGGTLWVWKEHGRWSAATPARAQLIARACPVRTAGTLLATTSNPTAGTAELRATSSPVRFADRTRGTLVRLPAPFAHSRLLVTGARMQVAVASGGRDVWLYPTGGPYRLSVRP